MRRQIWFPISLLVLTSIAVDVSAALLEKWGPTWSEVTGQNYNRAIMYRRPAIIKSVDGTDYLDRVVKMTPGQHTIRVQSPSQKGFKGSDQELQLDVAACKRYYVNAQFENNVGPDWKAVVAYVEPVPGCKVEAPKP